MPAFLGMGESWCLSTNLRKFDRNRPFGPSRPPPVQITKTWRRTAVSGNIVVTSSTCIDLLK
jgi:hypothetical protein